MARTLSDAPTDRDQLLADAHALKRLAEMPEWAVLERLLDEHADRIIVELCQRGLEPVATEGLRAELAAKWQAVTAQGYGASNTETWFGELRRSF